jgi:RHS repeat-associated protein
VRSSQPDAAIADFFIQADAAATDELRAVAGHLPEDFQLIAETESEAETTLYLGIYRYNHTTSTYTGLACGTMATLATSHFAGLTSEIVAGHRRYLLTAAAGGTFYDLIDGDPGRYQVRVSSQPCNGLDLSPQHRVDFIITPAQAVAIRFHYRDLLGSSALSRLYSPRFEGSEEGPTIERDLAGGHLTLYPHPPERTFYEPFGEAITGTTGETRYTDHEYDPNSGFNYMKGRYQLPEQYVFNRPDPQRDWDWLRPNTINLYQYTGNDPINGYDPDGFSLFELMQLNYAKADLQREKEIGPEAAKAERQESRLAQIAIGATVSLSASQL